MLLGAAAQTGDALAKSGRRADETVFETIEWQWTDGPVLTPPGGTVEENWDGASVHTPTLVRNLDRSIYRDGDGNMYLYYNGDNTSPGDLDQVGLAIGPSLDDLTRWSGNPVIPLGTDPAPDAGDAQITSAWHDGTKFVIYYQGNASAPGSGLGDNVTLCYATSLDGKTITKQGQVLDKGPDGDSEDHYWHRLVPNAPGGPRLYYAGKNANNVFGLMCATSSSIEGPWTRLRSDHLFRDAQTIIGDAWYEDGLYHFLHSPTDGVRGVIYSTSRDGVNIEPRKEVIKHFNGHWAVRPYHTSFFSDNGQYILLFNTDADIGIGYVYSPVA